MSSSRPVPSLDESPRAPASCAGRSQDDRRDLVALESELAAGGEREAILDALADLLAADLRRRASCP